MRLFLAIELSAAVHRQLADLSRQWHDNWGERLLGCSPRPYPACAWVRAQNLHLTLKFLGQVEDARLPEVCSALEQVRMPRALSLDPDRLELLPPKGPVRVIAVGLGGDIPVLQELHRSIEAACNSIGFLPEGREYRPHVTLARARIPLHASVRAALAGKALEHLPCPQMRASEFVLMESRLHRDGARYFPLARYPLTKPNERV